MTSIDKFRQIQSAKKSLNVSQIKNKDQEIAIVGFWKKIARTKEYKCDKYFYIPNPLKRYVLESKEKEH